MSPKRLCHWVIATLVVLATARPEPSSVDVFLVVDRAAGTRSWRVQEAPEAAAFNKTVAVTNIANIRVSHQLATAGWDGVLVTTYADSGATPFEQAYAAGYAEGYATQARIWQNYFNVMLNNGMPVVDDAIVAYIDRMRSYIQTGVEVNASSDPYWREVKLVLEQLQGLVDGYGAAAPAGQQLSWTQLYAVNFQTELAEVAEKYDNATEPPDGVAPGFRKLSPSWRMRRGKGGERRRLKAGLKRSQLDSLHCSALVRVVADDVFAAHATWASVTTMLRQMKEYRFAFAPAVKFSSYPGMLQSEDDWYMLSSGLVVQETTLENYNTTLNDEISAERVAEWIRVIVANRLAVDGASWATNFSKHNSGTYNNQWMVVDMKKFNKSTTPGGNATLGDGFFTVLEQMPTLIHWADLTDHMRQVGWWASYNIPYFSDINHISMTHWMAKHYGSFWNYNETARALQFHRGLPVATTLAQIQALIRLNNCTTDPLCRCDDCRHPPYSYGLAIAARCDLESMHSIDNLDYCTMDLDAIDAKVTSYNLTVGGTMLRGVAQSGPTYDPLPAFDWTSFQYRDYFNVTGMPDRYQFPWVTTDSLSPDA